MRSSTQFTRVALRSSFRNCLLAMWRHNGLRIATCSALVGFPTTICVVWPPHAEVRSSQPSRKLVRMNRASLEHMRDDCSPKFPDKSQLGECREFYERQVGSERFNFFIDGQKAKTCTLLLRGGSEQFIAETERSLHDAIMIVRRAKKNDSVAAGGCSNNGDVEKATTLLLKVFKYSYNTVKYKFVIFFLVEFG